MALLNSALAVISVPAIILFLAFADFLILHAFRQPATSYALSVLAMIYIGAGSSMYFGGDPLLSMPGAVILLFGIMQLFWGVYTIRQYQKKPQWGNL